ncbi:CRTAC1 family protein [Kiritimatiella glycovorans]|uniref:ASPIC/UnbV domain-containing protein n=1 Tax=Kiritimatiella glycovorans TaxID=1307763 RepID=A0A0G3EGL8_9BACT|nr:CRTAC1 family protein [Kiritimatiella glycovorans]AKJ63940.1 hypothetical protein L21SP4_00671 [Kiritimatiella glycovorans]
MRVVWVTWMLACVGFFLPTRAEGFTFSLRGQPVRNHVRYVESAPWSSQDVNDYDIVSIYSGAAVILDRDDTAGFLSVGRDSDGGTLTIEAPRELRLNDAVYVTNGAIYMNGGSLTAPEIRTEPEGEVRIGGGTVETDSFSIDGAVRVDGGILRTSPGTDFPTLIYERFVDEDQNVWATNDADLARQLGPDWRRANPADQETQYRISGNHLDIGDTSTTYIQKATLVHDRAEAPSGETGAGFSLSALMQQDTEAPSAFMGLAFNVQEDGSYYLFRVSGEGSAQFLVYTNFTKQGGTVLNKSGAFAPVPDRPYLLKVECRAPQTYDIAVEDTVAGTTVYSVDGLTVGGGFASLDGGVCGVYITHGLCAIDDFRFDAAPERNRLLHADGFTCENQTSWATNDAGIALQLGPYWRRANPADEQTQYRIRDQKLDISAVNGGVDQKAMLINTAAKTLNAGAGTNFTLSATMRQDTDASTAYMGVAFNYREDGSCYLFRVSGAGVAQFLVYSNYTQQAGTVMNAPGVFAPVQNRPYTVTVESRDPGVFDFRITDTADRTPVYSVSNVTVGGSYVQLEDGWGGIFFTHGLSAVDHYVVDAAPDRGAWRGAGAGRLDVTSGELNLKGGSPGRVFLDTARCRAGGGILALGQVYLGQHRGSEFSVVGRAPEVRMQSLRRTAGAAEGGVFRFEFDETGVSPVRVDSFAALDAAEIVVDGSAYTGAADRFTLFDAGVLTAPVPDENLVVTGFSRAYAPRIEQGGDRIELVVAPPDPFTDATDALGMGELTDGRACWFDFNGDAWIDLAAGGRVWVNHGGTNFTRGSWVGHVVAGDFDNDGWEDLFSHSHRRLFRNDGGTLVEDVPLPAFPDPYSCQGACWGDFNGDGWLDLYVTGYENGSMEPYPDYMLINNGGESFAMYTMETRYNARGVTSCDFDGDGDPDIYVSNYRLQPNLLWRNDGSGTFTEVASAYNAIATSPGYGGGHSIGACWGDFDNDGLFDLFAGNFAHPGQPESRFLRNRGAAHGHTFEDMGTCGIYFQESYASPAAADYDNDGRLDLFFTTVYEVATGGIRNYPVLFRNGGHFDFEAVDGSSLDELPDTYQAAWGDYNNDGRPDLVTAGRVFRNNGLGTNHWLKVRLRGDGSAVNRSAIGARVTLTAGTRTMARQVEAGTGQGNQNAPALHFGLGQADGPVDIEIAWPDGTLDTVTGVEPDRLITREYGSSAGP